MAAEAAFEAGTAAAAAALGIATARQGDLGASSVHEVPAGDPCLVDPPVSESDGAVHQAVQAYVQALGGTGGAVLVLPEEPKAAAAPAIVAEAAVAVTAGPPPAGAPGAAVRQRRITSLL